MSISTFASDSFAYAREAVWGKWKQWILLVVAYLITMFTLFIVPVFNGYLVSVLSGKTPAPEVTDWKKLFIDGWKLNIVALIYMIPVIIVLLIFGAATLPFALAGAQMADMTGAVPDQAMVGMMAELMAGLLVAFLIAVILSFIAYTGVVRFAKSGSIGEAFNFGAIFEHIGKIGWGSYIVAIIALWVILAVFAFIIGMLSVIPVIGWIINLFLTPVLSIFTWRYVVLLYESQAA
ncbi:MAG: DUF4013 domain-containing protein [Methanocalculus sp. MSAO_Arc1]|uniref:DUF4013 domain-containing protein n=1 Tax=Methanocalculus TaxID=71151 RepID=UPI000FF0314C|nr:MULTISPECIES: DUF4013 domain-containing protein [unclassified Methanocalculus]MCP1661892.1 hypothetical protein [Methanocalculus sp. AMF5]RQD81221.1 MAG: DUF4013 domain-containing protein [Methanocalculus sp. MSAO_Arc1]